MLVQAERRSALQVGYHLIVFHRRDFNHHGHTGQARAVDNPGREDQHSSIRETHMLSWRVCAEAVLRF